MIRLVGLLLLGLLLVVAPGAMDSPLGGPPLGASGRAAIGLVCLVAVGAYVFRPRVSPGWLPVLVVAGLVGLKMIMGLLAVPHGWRAEYRFGDRTGRVHTARFFWRYASRPFRVDPLIAFKADVIDVHFFNDVPLFGYPPYSGTRREEEFPLWVSWQAFASVPAPRRVALRVEGEGEIRLRVDRQDLSWRREAGTLIEVPLEAGTHHFEVHYEKPAGLQPWVVVIPTDAETGQPFPVTPWPSPGRTWGASRPTSLVVWLGVAVVAVTIGRAYVRHGAQKPVGGVAVRLVPLAATAIILGWGVTTADALLGKTAFLHGGGDPLVYAGFARDILHHGPLMLLGKPVGQAQPFYFYPLYPYVLAAAHALIGEDWSSIVLLNGLCLAVLPVLCWELGWKHLRPRTAALAFAALVGFVLYYCAPVAAFEEPAFPDFLFMALVVAGLLAFTRAVARPRPHAFVFAGALLALGAAARPSLMTMVYLAPAVIWLSLRAHRVGRRAAWTAWLVAGVALGLAPFTLRNLVAAGQPVVLVNSWIQIPYFLVPPEVQDKPGGQPGLGEALAMARDTFVAHPAGTLWVQIRKILFTLGVTAVGPRDMASSNGLGVLTVLFWASVWRGRICRPLLAVLATFAVSHLTAMVIAAPWTFWYKNILPLHLVFLFGAAFLLDSGREHAAELCVTRRPGQTHDDLAPRGAAQQSAGRR
ncbi:MAG: glycosyltransferase family 39 protein [Armatimonadota bacterium]|nr:glycosyltransferase family 39 protein [Armatimonadota bacterium]